MAAFVITVAVCVAVLTGQANSLQMCGHASWGEKTVDVVVDKSTISAHKIKADVDIPGMPDCTVVGVEVIACDSYEEPSVMFSTERNAVVLRQFAEDVAEVATIRYCVPFVPPTMGSAMGMHHRGLNMQGHVPHAPAWF